MRPNDLVLVGRGSATEVIVDDPHVIRLLGISSTFLEQAVLAEGRPHKLDFEFLHKGSFRDKFISSVIERLWTEAEKGDVISRLFADGASLVLLSALLGRVGTNPASAKGGLAPWQVRRATDMIRSNLQSDLSLEALATEVGLSPWHFARSFTRSVGLPPHAFQVRCRIERAKSLLLGTDAPITQISLEVGYESSQSLARAFRMAEGLSPSAFRRSRR
jgi:AraC family transcriptional regulator